jgi:TolB-like protein
VLIRTLLASIFLSFAAGAATPGVTKAGKRTVAVFPFVNTRTAKNFAYLEESLSDAISGELGKLKVFEFSAPADIQSNKKSLGSDYPSIVYEHYAARVGEKMHSDVIVTGNFLEIEGTMLVQAKAIDVASGRSKVSKSSIIKTDATMFDNIQKLAADMSGDMARALGPLEGREDFFKGTAFTLGTGLAAPLGTFANYYQTGWMLTGSVAYPLFRTILFGRPLALQALISFSYMQQNGRETYEQSFRQAGMAAGAQISTPLLLPELKIFANTSFGYAQSTLSRDYDGREFRSLDSYLRMGLGAEWHFTPAIFVQGGTHFTNVFFTGASQTLFTLEAAVGYKIQ